MANISYKLGQPLLPNPAIRNFDLKPKYTTKNPTAEAVKQLYNRLM